MKLLLILFISFNAHALTWDEGTGNTITFTTTTSPDSVTRVSGSSAYLNLVSNENVASGEIEISFTYGGPINSTTDHYIGFQSDPVIPNSTNGESRNQKDFSVNFRDTNTRVYEGSSNTFVGPVITTSDVIKLAINSSGFYEFYINDTLLYTSTSTTAQYPARIGIGLGTNGRSVNNIFFGEPPSGAGTFSPFSRPNPPGGTLTGKGNILTSDGVDVSELPACADGQVLIFNSANGNGLSCGAN